MNRLLSFTAVFLVWANLGLAQSDFKIHSHNDYLQKVPFWEAYAANAASIEADVILKDGKLFVAHEPSSIQETRILQTLYFDPIREGLQKKLIDGIDFILLIDLKTEAYSTLDKLLEITKAYEDLFYSDQNQDGLKLVISGNRPKPSDYVNYPDYMLFDYQSLELDEKLPWEKIGMVSMGFGQFSVWNGKGRIVESEKSKLDQFVSKVHSFNKPARFWGTPDSKTAWKAFHEMGVDYINTDQPSGAYTYLENLPRGIYSNTDFHTVYTPAFAADNTSAQVQNVILMIGDGTGLAQISAGLFTNKNVLNLAQFRNIGLVKTQAADDFTTDSAAGATAFSTGHKTNNRAIGVDPQGEPLQNLPELLHTNGYYSGIITTDQLTGATPAAFYAHEPERDSSNEIAAWLAKSPINLFLGGGKNDFDQLGTDRIAELERAGYELVNSVEEVASSASGKVGLFISEGSPASMVKGRGDFLGKSAIAAFQFFENHQKPFFLMIEAAKIDSGGHANDTEMIVSEMLDFDQAIGTVMQYVDNHPGTLLIVTADHETGGVSIPQGDIAKGTVELAYHSDDHTGILVPLFAYGAGSSDFQGFMENTEVHEKILKLLSF